MSKKAKPHFSLCTIILAAGKGTRMKSSRAKVLHEVFFAPMVHHVVRAVLPLEAKKNIAVVGHQGEQVRASLAGFSVACVEQRQQNGTGHAVLAVEQAVPTECANVLILCGDTPLVRSRTLLDMVAVHEEKGADLTLLTTRMDDPFGYGRVLQDTDGRVRAIVEEKDASDDERRIAEINGGIYCVGRSFLFSALKEITPDNSQNELYLTDIVGIAVSAGRRVERFQHRDAGEILGINSREQLARAHGILTHRRNLDLMAAGVTILDPATTYIAPGVSIGADTVVQPQVQILGRSWVGEGAAIGSCSVLTDCTVAAAGVVPPGTVATGFRFSGQG